MYLRFCHMVHDLRDNSLGVDYLVVFIRANMKMRVKPSSSNPTWPDNPKFISLIFQFDLFDS